MDAKELMTQRCDAYMHVVKTRCGLNCWDSDFENLTFVGQCFDEIQHFVMSEIHGDGYRQPDSWPVDIERDYELTSVIRENFIFEAHDYVMNMKDRLLQIENASPDDTALKMYHFCKLLDSQIDWQKPCIAKIDKKGN